MALRLESIRRKSADEGEFVDIPEWPGVRFKVRSLGSKDYNLQRELMIAAKTRTLGRAPTSAEMEPDLGRLVATYLWRGWEGLAGSGDVPVEYSPEKAVELLTDPEMRELEAQVIWAASRVGAQEVQFTTAAAKNS